MMYLFGYGSLINRESAQKSFARKLVQTDLIPVVVHDVTPVWNSIEIIDFAERQQVPAVFLNLEPCPGSEALGVLVAINEQEYAGLQQREKNYSCVSLAPSQISGFSPNEEIITFRTTNPEKIAHPGEKSIIAQGYLDLLEQGLAAYDQTFQTRYRQQVLTRLPFPVQTGSYRFSDPLQNKLAREGLHRG